MATPFSISNPGISQDVSPSLKEIANRINKLSYRDLKKFAGLLQSQLEHKQLPADALLAVADQLEKDAA